MNNTNTPMAEAKIQVRRGAHGTWRDSLDFDPVQIPVEQFEGADRPYLTDVFDATVYGLVDSVLGADVDANMEWNLVWSDSGFSVKGVCPVCDDVFTLSEGCPGDELNEGYDAVFCGCDPRDNDED